jgi:SWI/SNF-related matrix-associated actin-dependent regulator of chromatin subfamily D
MQYIQSMQNSKTKRDFLLRFANDPADFLDRWVASQSRDLEVILGESHVNLEEQRRADFYNQQWVNEAVFHYMTAKNQKKLQELLGGHPQPVPPPQQQGGAPPAGHPPQQPFPPGMAPGHPGGRF